MRERGSVLLHLVEVVLAGGESSDFRVPTPAAKVESGHERDAKAGVPVPTRLRLQFHLASCNLVTA